MALTLLPRLLAAWCLAGFGGRRGAMVTCCDRNGTLAWTAASVVSTCSTTHSVDAVVCFSRSTLSRKRVFCLRSERFSASNVAILAFSAWSFAREMRSLPSKPAFDPLRCVMCCFARAPGDIDLEVLALVERCFVEWR